MSRPEEEIGQSVQSGESPVEPGQRPVDNAGPEPTARSSGSPAAPLLMGVKLPIRVLMGRTQLPLREIARLGGGSVVELGCSPDSPVDIIVNDRLIAQGEIVVIGGNYGVRITSIASSGQTPREGQPEFDLHGLSERLK
jgi:flagellar motor switch protein FliN/FliY